MPKKKLPRSPHLNPRFSTALEQFSIALKNTGSIQHSGSKGQAREAALRLFFEQRLPKKFAVTHGEVVDIRGQTSPQLDIMFYDQTVNFSLAADDIGILPAEALLASVEVKSVLNKQEIQKSVKAAKLLKDLKPFNRPLVSKNPENPKDCRYYHCLFAYSTDLGENDWAKKEIARVLDTGGDMNLFDCIYVLNQGIINLPNQIWGKETAQGVAITSFYFSILNFIEREANRRPPVPLEHYVRHDEKLWVKIK